MATSKLKLRRGCLAWAVWLLLHAQQNNSLVAFAGDSNGNVVGTSVSTDEESLEDLGLHEFQQVSDEAAIVEATTWLSRSSAAVDEDLEVADEDGFEATRGAVVEGDRARIIRDAKSMFRVIAGVVLLVTIARLLVINGQAALHHSASRLRRLQALMPIAETLSVAVGTRESERLWAAVKALLPEIEQTLSSAEIKLTSPGFFFFGRYGGHYRDLMNSVHNNVRKVSEAIAALHTNARDQVELMAKRMPGRKSSEIAAVEDQLEKALGSEFAKAFVTFVDSQEAQASGILRAASQVIVQSYKMPMFADERDKALLIATIHNVDEMKQLLTAREGAQEQIEEAKKSCRQAIASTLRADLVAAAHQYRGLFKGMSIFFERPELQGEGDQLMRRGLETAKALLDSEFPSLWYTSSKDLSVEELLEVYAKFHCFTEKITELLSLPDKHVIHEGQGDDRLSLQKKASNLMQEAADHAESMSRQAQKLMDEMKQRQAEAPSGSFCPNVMLTFDHSMKTLLAHAQDNAKLCKQVADQLAGDAAVESLFETLVKGLNKGSRVAKMYRGMQAVRGYLDLLQVIETNVRSSLDVNNGVNVDNMNPQSNKAKLIISAKDEVAEQLAALKETVSLPRAAQRAARIGQAASSAAFALYKDIVLHLEEEHKRRGSNLGTRRNSTSN
ncbi:hypothetical protein Emag_005507 [Eimeria magna]